MRHDDRHGAFLLLRDRLALDARVDLAVCKILHKLANVLLGEFLVLGKEGEFLILGDFLNSERRELVCVEVEIGGVLAKGFGVNGCEVNLALVLFRNGLELFGEGVPLFWGFGEDVRERKASLGCV